MFGQSKASNFRKIENLTKANLNLKSELLQQ